MDQVGLCNAALDLVSANRITSIDEASIGARLCKGNWAIVRDAILEAKEWTFAIRRERLSAETTGPAFGFAASYAIPSDVVRVLTARTADDRPVEWVREGWKLLCDEAGGLDVRFIIRVEDTALWSPGFQVAFTYLLACRITSAINEDAGREAQLYKLYEVALKKAATRDGMQGLGQAITPGDWLRASRF